jgi:hypothetical protein
MRIKIWLMLGALVGLVAGIVIDSLLRLPTLELRLLQLVLVLFGAVVAAFIYEGAKAVTSGMNPAATTDRRRRVLVRRPSGRAL